jgi:FtsZ-binding cell division protein ZapB
MMARLEAKMGAEIKTIQERMEDRQKNLKAHMASVASRTEDNNEKFEVLRDTLVSRMDSHQERLMGCLGKTETTDLEANPKEIEFETEHERS